MVLMKASRSLFVGVGSNLGDRSGNLAQAIQGLRRLATIHALSSMYETRPIAVQGPAFLNMVVHIGEFQAPERLAEQIRALETKLGRTQNTDLGARSIDIEIIDLEQVHQQPYYLVALAELAPELLVPNTGQSFAALASMVDPQSYKRRERTLSFTADRQSESPEIALSIDQVGVARVRRTVRLLIDGRERELSGQFSMTADLAQNRAGVHMSRFSEHLESATLDILAQDPVPTGLDLLLSTIAQAILGAQGAASADVHFEAAFTLERWTPVSGRRGEETYLLLGHAHATAQGVRSIIGVEVEGMTACPCAQLMMREQGTRELALVGFTEQEAAKALDALPAATHNQRGRGRVCIGLPSSYTKPLSIEDLVALVEQSMSSETYELLKRPDEFFVVNKAHQNPKFVEDVVRGILGRALDFYHDLPETTFIEASQINDESIHKHDAIARAHGTFGELRAELAGRPRTSRRSDRAQWLTSQEQLSTY